MQPRFPPPFNAPPGQQQQPPGGAPNPQQLPPRFPFPGMPGMLPGMMHGMMPGMFPGMPGMPPFNLMMMPGMVPPGMPMMPGMPGMPPFGQFPMPVPGATVPGAAPGAPQVIVGAPVLRAPSTALPATYANNATNNINIFNSNNNVAASAVSNTSNLLHKHVFCNAHAGLPLTVFIGKIPLDFEDAKLAKIVEACGKVTKLVRPTDPVTELPSSIAFVTYAQAICGLRCRNILDGLEVGLSDEGEPQRLEVKTSTRDTAPINSVQQAETDAAATLPEGSSLEEIYDPIRENIARVIKPPAPPSTAPPEAATEAAGAATDAAKAGDQTVDNDAAAAAVLGAMIDSDAARVCNVRVPLPITGQDGGNYYSFMEGAEEGEEVEDGEGGAGDGGEGEKLLYSEIEKFRIRQTQRDKLLEEQKRARVKQRIKELTEARKNALNNPPPVPPPAMTATQVAALAAKSEAQLHDYHSLDSSKKRVSEEDSAEQEAKRRRRLEVLRAMAGDSSIVELPEDAPPPSKAPAAPQPLKLAISTAGLKKQQQQPAGGGAAKTSFLSGADGDDDDKPKRGLVLLDYTAEEVAELEKAYAQYGKDDEDDEEVAENGVVYKKKRQSAQQPSLADILGGKVAVPNDLQARVLAQAQAISSSLAQKITANIASVESSAAAKAGGGTVDQKAELRQLLDKIPTQRDELFVYPIDWGVIERAGLIASTMRGWIVKKVAEYLGEEEEALTAFIVGKLDASCRPAELVQELSMVLDEDAEQFVLKLWRMLVYYSLKGQQDEKMQ